MRDCTKRFLHTTNVETNSIPTPAHRKKNGPSMKQSAAKSNPKTRLTSFKKDEDHKRKTPKEKRHPTAPGITNNGIGEENSANGQRSSV
jgi:hypothetical protein